MRYSRVARWSPPVPVYVIINIRCGNEVSPFQPRTVLKLFASTLIQLNIILLPRGFHHLCHPCLTMLTKMDDVDKFVFGWAYDRVFVVRI